MLILASSAPRSGGFGDVEPAAAILGGQAERIAGAADQPTLGRFLVEHVAALGVAREQMQRDHLVDDAGELAAGLGAFHLRLPGRDVELVGDLLQHADEDHGLARRVLQVLERLDDLAPKQAVGAAHVGLAGAFGERLRLLSWHRPSPGG